MLGKTIAWAIENLVYRFPKQDDPTLFNNNDTHEQKQLSMRMLRSLLHASQPDEVSAHIFNAIGRQTL